ncbi:gamma tubulin complex component 5 [Echinococcus multilocularis]|uniref:Gamma-tubulin complex component n=1 Tax=Echinococcus multilocularis TaxID=6211 RepID=A0A068YKY4_ECHMU|nr:gamma tubulin complex component 5 [Echinococcus multilocularis]
MADTSDTDTVTSVDFVGVTFPCPWSDLPPVQPSSCELENFDEVSLIKKIQTEYWWIRETHIKTGPDKSSNFKNTWLFSSEKGQSESRIELSEYQVVRECLWALLGAGKGFLFAYCTDCEVLVRNICLYARKPACLTHLTYGALDAFCVEIAKYCTCILQIRAFTDFVLLAVPGTVPLPFIRLAESCARLTQDTYRTIASLEEDARMPDTPPLTLVSLTSKLQSWFRRLSFMASLILQVCSPQLTTVMSDTTSILLLNRLEELSCTLSHHLSDPYLVGLINNVYISATEAYLSDLLSKSGGRLFSAPFLRRNSDFSPTHPMFWEFGITLHKNIVPSVLLPVINDVFVGVKSLTLLQTTASTFRIPKIAEICRPLTPPVINCSNVGADSVLELDPLDDPELHELAKLMHSIALKKPSNTLLLSAPRKWENSPSRTIQHLMESVRLLSKRISAQLYSSLLQGPLVLTSRSKDDSVSDSFHLTHAFTCLADVAFFRAGDRMNIFCQSLFLLRPGERTEAEVNGMLKEQLTLICGEKSWIHGHIRIGLDNQGNVMGDNVQARASALRLWVDVPWPLNIVLTEKNLGVYQQVFTFLLMLKHAKWALDSARWAQSAATHKMAILRSRFLFVINGLYAFILDNIEAAHVRFMREVTQLQDDCSLDTLMTSFTNYLTRIVQLCLLEDCASQQILNQALRGLFELCLHFQLPNVAESHLAGEFSTRVAFLRTILAEAMQDSGRREKATPFLHVLELAHRFNTDMQTRLHFNR